MAVGMATTLRNARLSAIRDAIDAGPAQGKLNLYAGTRPATGASPAGSTLIGTLLFSDPCAAEPSNGVLTFNSISDDLAADASGTVAWARITDSNNVFVMDVDVTDTNGNGEIRMNDVVVTANDILRVTSAQISEAMA